MEHIKLKEMGRTLRALRFGKGITLDSAADKLGCSRRALNYIESGESLCMSRVFLRYCELLGVEIIFDIDDAVYRTGINRMRFDKQVTGSRQHA